jgi:hypothetical protein
MKEFFLVLVIVGLGAIMGVVFAGIFSYLLYLGTMIAQQYMVT